MTRIDEINARLAAIAEESKTAEGEALAELEREAQELMEERSKLQSDIEKRNALRASIAAGTEPATVTEPASIGGARAQASDEAEARAKKFMETKRTVIEGEQTRAALISGGTLATPTGVDGINEQPGARVSSIIDLVSVENCVGMGSDKVAYVDTYASAAGEQTEGQTIANADDSGTYGFVTITPTSILSLAYISKQAKKQTPLVYEAKVKAQALLALRKKVAALLTSQLTASTLNASVTATLDANSKGKIDDKTLRNIALAYGGDESVVGDAWLFLNKTDLIAFGDVRGTNEKKPVYEIIPDASNPNTGVIKDGGLSVRYCINSGLTACAGTAQSSSAAKKTMVYGNPKALRLDLFSDYEIAVSEDFKFDALLDTIRGDAEVGADVVAKNAFVVLTIAKGS